MAHEISIGSRPLTLGDVIAVAREGARVSLSPEAVSRAESSRKCIETWVAEGKVIYGITTGFGALCHVTISPKDTETLQRNILMSHAGGVGNLFPEEVVRAVMLLRVNDLALGYGGIRLETLEHMVALLNEGVTPLVPEKGSVGASGDLAPMSHIGLVLIGLGEAFYRGRRMAGGEALREIGLEPLRMQAGEGLALVNGTQVMTAVSALCIHDALRLVKLADIACSQSLEVLMGTNTQFDPRIHEVRPHRGQAQAASNMRRITRDSEIMSSHKDCSRVQDPYTLRCSPQIHGASRDAVEYVRGVVVTEMNSTTTNPLIFADSGNFLLGGNFHGQPVALAADFLAIALSELANVSERRTERLVNPQLSGLPAFLVENGGLNSGYMIAQYVAAALVSENKVLAHPASVDSIPTSANKEDHVSMGTIAARKAREILANVQNVIAIELLCGAQGLDIFTNLKAGEGTREVYRSIRERIPHLERDRELSPDIEAAADLLRSGEIIRRVEAVVGELD